MDRWPVVRVNALLALVATLVLPSVVQAADAQPSPQEQAVKAGESMEKLKRKYGDSMSHYEVDHDLKMVFATALDDRSHKEVKEFVSAHAKAMQRDLFAHPIERYLTVVIPKKWANPKVTGHFYPPAYVDAATIGSNLRHEFTHALHFADQQGRGQEHPVWIMEGLAVLYQDSRIIDSFAVPQITYRVMELQQEVQNKKIYAFPVMMKLVHRAFTSHHYQQAGSMLMYLYQKGLLKTFYEAFTTGYKEDPTGIAACEKVCGKKIGEVQKDWVEWLLKLPPPLPLPGENRPSLGLGFKQHADGLVIDQLATGGPAEAAQLKTGDVLVRLGDQRIVDDDDLIRVVFSSTIGGTLPIQYRRGDQYVDAKITIAGAAKQVAPEK
jgi:hypothetical protein